MNLEKAYYRSNQTTMWDVLKEYAGSKRLLNSMKAFNNDADASF